MFSLESHTKPKASMVENQIPRREGHSICYLHPPPFLPSSKDDRHPNPWNFAWSLKCCPCPLKKWNLKGSFLVSTFEKFVLLSVGIQILSASLKKKSEPPYSKTHHHLGGGGRYKMEHSWSTHGLEINDTLQIQKPPLKILMIKANLIQNTGPRD